MKRVVLVGVLVVLSVVIALPAVALMANNTGLTPTGRSGDTSYGTAGGAEYNKKKVCVKHYTSANKNRYQYIKMTREEYRNGHKQHGDVIVADRYCRR